MAKKIKKEMNAEVELIHGRYGEFKVAVNGETIINGGAKVILGIMPSAGEIITAIKAKS